MATMSIDAMTISAHLRLALRFFSVWVVLAAMLLESRMAFVTPVINSSDRGMGVTGSLLERACASWNAGEVGGGGVIGS